MKKRELIAIGDLLHTVKNIVSFDKETIFAVLKIKRAYKALIVECEEDSAVFKKSFEETLSIEDEGKMAEAQKEIEGKYNEFFASKDNEEVGIDVHLSEDQVINLAKAGECSLELLDTVMQVLVSNAEEK